MVDHAEGYGRAAADDGGTFPADGSFVEAVDPSASSYRCRTVAASADYSIVVATESPWTCSSEVVPCLDLN